MQKLGKREIPHWHCNKRWTDVEKTREALAILRTPTFEKKTWNEGKQAYYALLLNKKGLSGSTNPRSTRAILGTYKFFGLAYTKQRKLLITPAGQGLTAGNIREVMKSQLLKWQYPNPFESKGGVAPYTGTLRLFPFRVVLQLLTEIGPVREDELSLFVWKIRSHDRSEIDDTKKEILDYRKLTESEKRKVRKTDLLFITKHEYEAHLRPYILATDLCSFDEKRRLLSVNGKAQDEVGNILGETVEVKTDWKDEDEWFEYFGDPRYYHPPIETQIKFSSKGGPVSGLYVRVRRNCTETYKITDNKGFVRFSMYEDFRYVLEVIQPKDGSILHRKSLIVRPKTRDLKINIVKAPIRPKETLDTLMQKTNELLKSGFDEEILERLNMKSRIEKKGIDKRQMRYIRGGRFEELIYRMLNLFKKTVFDDVVWNGKTGEWGLPVPAQKVSEETGKKLPDILVFQDNDIYVVEATLLRGRAQWEKPEAVSVPEHIEDMITRFKGKDVSGLFIVKELDPSVKTNLITRAINNGYKVVPLEAEDFLGTVKLLEGSSKAFWKTNYNHLWSIYKKSAVKTGP